MYMKWSQDGEFFRVYIEKGNKGCLLGLAMAISAFCEKGKMEASTRVATIYDKLCGLLESSQERYTAYQVQCNVCQLKAI